MTLNKEALMELASRVESAAPVGEAELMMVSECALALIPPDDNVRGERVARLLDTDDAFEQVAITCVPSGYAWTLSNVGPSDCPHACVTEASGDYRDFEGSAATPAFALFAAALRSLASQVME